MPTLPPKPDLAAFQTYVRALEVERGFDRQTPIEKCLLLGEEVGELFKSVRKAQGLATDTQTDVSPVAEELADVFILLLSVANRHGVDLEQAFRAKEVKNHSRSWK
ncbi:MAG: MazG nucleotide pyrophosphohydrolase domain-containing protein [Archangium sp.]